MRHADHTPPVNTILICHSMGGIVGVDSFLAMQSDSDPMHARILGIMAYDTPFLGINPPVIQRTVSTQVNTVSSAISSAKEWIPQRFLSKQGAPENPPAQKSKWGLGKLAAVGAGVAAVGALSYFARDSIVDHLQFVSALYKQDSLASRMKQVRAANVGFTVFYTVTRDEA